VVVPSGSAALVAAVELRPWIVFVGADVVGWPQTKTCRSLMALKEAGRVRTIPLPKTAEPSATLEIFTREFGQSPFEVEMTDGETSVRVSETFTPGCMRALKRDIDAALARGTGRIIFDIPYHSIQRGALLVLQELVHSLRKDG
jgi:hypothetical protein